MHFTFSTVAASLLAVSPAMGQITQSFSTPATTPLPTFALAHGGALDIEAKAARTTAAARLDIVEDNRWTHAAQSGNAAAGGSSQSHGHWQGGHRHGQGQSQGEGQSQSEVQGQDPTQAVMTTQIASQVQPQPKPQATVQSQSQDQGEGQSQVQSQGQGHTRGSGSRHSHTQAQGATGITQAQGATGITQAQGATGLSQAPLPTTAPSLSQAAGASAGAGAGAGAGSGQALTFEIVNQSPGISISISYQLNTYINTDTKQTTVAPALKASASTGVFASATTVIAPLGWAGRMTIGKAGAPLDYRGTKIEGNFGFNTADTDPDVDVSYVDGYSLPAVCSCGDTPVTGCNKPLFQLGNTCSNLVGDSDHPICVNEPRNAHGPATPFFAPCAGSAYTFDYDDGANYQGKCAGNVIKCCIGPTCQAPSRQPTSNTKREVMGLIGAGLSL